MKPARTVWSRGKDGDYIKILPIAIAGMTLSQETRYKINLAQQQRVSCPPLQIKCAFLYWKKLSIKREEVICIGDGGNDLSMVEYAGCGVAMGNAIPAVKEAADFQTLSNDEHGVAHAIEKLVLNATPELIK